MMPGSLFPIFKYGVYALLMVNVYLFFRHASFHEGLDCVGWVMLLAVFEWETRKEENAPHVRAIEKFLLVVQVIAYALILHAWNSYYLEEAWLDFVNASLWLGVVFTLYADLHWNGRSLWRARHLRYAVKFALYSSLITIATIWGVEGDFLNFYDAFLWIVCFFAIEMNLLQHAHRSWQRIRNQR